MNELMRLEACLGTRLAHSACAAACHNRFWQELPVHAALKGELSPLALPPGNVSGL